MKAYAKINIFLKLTGLDSRGYHLLNSRFIRLFEPFDELFLSTEKKQDGFEIISDFKCEENLIEKAYKMLCSKGFESELKEAFKHLSVNLIKNIPVGAGLGGGSSDAASFLLLVNEELNLRISKEKLIKMSLELGSDVAFFLSGFLSAHVSGTGEVVQEFEDNIPKIELQTSDIFCSTPKVYKEFDRLFDKNLEAKFKQSLNESKELLKLSSKQLLNRFEPEFLNDLYKPCLSLYPQMKELLEKKVFLSGSGSAVFKRL